MTFTIIAILLLAFFICFIIAKFAFKQVFLAKRKTKETAFEAMKQRNIYDKSEYESLNFSQEEIVSIDRLKLKGYHLKTSTNNNKVILLIHGYTGNHFMSLQFVNLFKDLSYDIFMIDARSHGDSEGSYPTYGIMEKEDIRLWINHIRSKYPHDITIGLHGQSMGAATSLLYGEKYKDIDFIIADCPFSDAKQVLCYQFAEVAHVPPTPIYSLLNAYTRYFCGLNFEDSSPISNIPKMNIPVLFIHGTSDSIIPFAMSEELYKTKAGSNDELLLVKNAEHVEAYSQNKSLYENTVKNFITKITKDNDY
ncbi:MAG: alpha/beta hydrolase [Clostridium sp.]